ncbi:MAG: class I SAM-dependent methyltransferase [Promethearchaeota archaeon]|nr:MAG: class I SAM-dependent methyltransferase [Candidatus Lokiarchaeota archaeon]
MPNKKRNKKNPLYNLQGSNLWKNKGIKGFFYKYLRNIFNLGQKLGLHIIPNHYYYPVPDTRFLTTKTFTSRSELIGINMNVNEQLELLNKFNANYAKEFNDFPRFRTKIPHQYYVTNGNFRSVDGEILYCMIRDFKPKKIIEIGSGYSTFCSAQAILKNEEEDKNYSCELIAIEPYPNKILQQGFPGLTEVMIKNLQDVPIKFFKKLTENDILFIDSSHILNIGNDVYLEYLEILPRLNKGVLVHIHDIFLPAEYPPEWVLNLLRFFNEQYLLQSFLCFNDDFKILWASKYMQMEHSEKLENIFKSFKRDRTELNKMGPDMLEFKKRWPIEWPTSFWIKRIR